MCVEEVEAVKWTIEGGEKYVYVESYVLLGTPNMDGGSGTAVLQDDGTYKMKYDISAGTQTQVTWGTADASLNIPFLVTSETTTEDLLNGGDRSGCDVVVAPGGTLNVNTTKTIHKLTLYAGATLNVQDSYTLSVNSLVLHVDDDQNAPIINLNSTGELALNNDEMYFDMHIDESRYYWFSLPFDAELQEISYADVASNGKTPVYRTDFWVFYYDGARRAADANGGAKAETYWTHVASKGGSYTLQAGQGYELGIANQKSKYFNGQDYHHTKRIIRIPMSVDADTWTAVDRGAGKVVVIDPSTCVAPQNAVHAGWNLIGNPYLHSYHTGSVDGESGLRNGAWVMDSKGKYYEVDGETVDVPYVTLYDPSTRTYSQDLAANRTIRPFEAVFVQVNIGNVVHFANPTNVTVSRNHAPRRFFAETERPLYTGIRISGNDKHDRAGVVLAEEFAPTYEIGADLAKMTNANALNLYTLNADNQKLAFNALSDEDAIAPISVGVTIPAIGEYTFSFDDEQYSVNALDTLMLIDKAAGISTNLLYANYTFEIEEAGAVNNRFEILVRRAKDQPQITTDVDNIYEEDKPRKFIRNGQLFIINDGKMYNAVGTEVR